MIGVVSKVEFWTSARPLAAYCIGWDACWCAAALSYFCDLTIAAGVFFIHTRYAFRYSLVAVHLAQVVQRHVVAAEEATVQHKHLRVCMMHQRRLAAYVLVAC